jgi:hypothetical protein
MMIFSLVCFSAVGPPRNRRSRSLGSFFMRYTVIAVAGAPNTARKAHACQ